MARIVVQGDWYEGDGLQGLLGGFVGRWLGRLVRKVGEESWLSRLVGEVG